MPTDSDEEDELEEEEVIHKKAPAKQRASKKKAKAEAKAKPAFIQEVSCFLPFFCKNLRHGNSQADEEEDTDVDDSQYASSSKKRKVSHPIPRRCRYILTDISEGYQ